MAVYYQYFFIDVPRLKVEGKEDCIAMAYTWSHDIEAHYREVDVPAGKLVWNDDLLRLPGRTVGVPQIVLQVPISKGDMQ